MLTLSDCIRDYITDKGFTSFKTKNATFRYKRLSPYSWMLVKISGRTELQWNTVSLLPNPSSLNKLKIIKKHDLSAIPGFPEEFFQFVPETDFIKFLEFDRTIEIKCSQFTYILHKKIFYDKKPKC
jgi:hypothetical protein